MKRDDEMKSVIIPKGIFEMGDAFNEGVPFDYETPTQLLMIDAFEMDETPVTNQAFQQFIEATGYVTEAEKFGWSYVFYMLIPEEERTVWQSVPQTPWWLCVDGATWKTPEGAGSNIYNRMDHPVVHVSRNDAIAYCQWAGKRLPTEAQWEYAARANSTTRFPWGDELVMDNQYMANTWQGNFPRENEATDGYVGTAPVYTYTPNVFGLYQMIGNTWEWCANPSDMLLSQFTKLSADDIWENHVAPSDADYAIRGGSFLCHHTYCKRYRVAARNHNSGSSTSSNTSFRCIRVISNDEVG